MTKSQILVYDVPLQLREELISAVSGSEDFEVIGIAATLPDASLMLEKISPDVLIIGASDETSMALTLVRRAETLTKRPLIVVLTPNPQIADAFPLCVTEGKLVFTLPIDVAAVLSGISSRLIGTKTGKDLTVFTDYDRQLDEKLTKIFISSGIPPHIKGYMFLREAVKISMRNPMMINNITRGLYPAIAEKYTTTPSKVERAIRHAIEVAWARGKIENLNTLYGIKIFNKADKPTNGELIALISDGMLTDCI